MNPGKIVRASRMDDAALFRFAPDYRITSLDPALDWSAWNVDADPLTEATTPPGSGGDPARGFGKAVEMCNNNGHCRKFDAGTMCPSYRVTRDEVHSTRGRANTLRLAVSGQLDGGLASADVRAALDLCVGCKGCRRECPTGVDMARMKIEARDQWRRRHGVALRERLFATLPRWAPWASRMPWLLRARNLPIVDRLVERLLGISARRSLPAFARVPFLDAAPAGMAGGNAAASRPATNGAATNGAATSGVATGGATAGGATAGDGSTGGARAGGATTGDAMPDVVLFVDTFTNYVEPWNARAALAVLEAAGRATAVARAPHGERPLCCGRTYLAAGLVDEAKREARRLVAALAPHVQRGAAIVGLEPSCLLTLRDEFTVMGLDDAATALAKRAFLFEEFLAAEHRAGRLALPLAPLPQSRALLHGHCHQKAFGAMDDVRTVLALVPGLAVDAVESSCCGMAGSFGYEAEHFDLSRAMAELALLPAVRAAAPDTLVVADGTSCRHQIADDARASAGRSAGREPLHVAQVLERALVTHAHASPPR
jgi:Fe-S oxidoreductase